MAMSWVSCSYIAAARPIHWCLQSVLLKLLWTLLLSVLPYRFNTQSDSKTWMAKSNLAPWTSGSLVVISRTVAAHSRSFAMICVESLVVASVTGLFCVSTCSAVCKGQHESSFSSTCCVRSAKKQQNEGWRDGKSSLIHSYLHQWVSFSFDLVVELWCAATVW